MNTPAKPILVTGSHRSGTTWAGKMIAATPQVGYIQEPFNPGITLGDNPQPFKHYFHYLCPENQGDYDKIFSQMARFHYPLGRNLSHVRNPRHLYRIARAQSQALAYRSHHSRALFKDPIAFFSAEWLYKTLNMNVLVMIRHPAAFCSSLILRGWTFDFTDFLSQPLLMERYLAPFAADIQAFANEEQPLLEQGILLWNIFHSVIQEQQKQYADWLFIKHEELSLDPISEFQAIYKALGLTFNEAAMDAVVKSSGAHNPSEQQAGTPLKKYSNRNVKRNSLANIKNWQKRLSPEDIATIRAKTEHISSAFYTDSDWA